MLCVCVIYFYYYIYKYTTPNKGNYSKAFFMGLLSCIVLSGISEAKRKGLSKNFMNSKENIFNGRKRIFLFFTRYILLWFEYVSHYQLKARICRQNILQFFYCKSSAVKFLTVTGSVVKVLLMGTDGWEDEGKRKGDKVAELSSCCWEAACHSRCSERKTNNDKLIEGECQQLRKEIEMYKGNWISVTQESHTFPSSIIKVWCKVDSFHLGTSPSGNNRTPYENAQCRPGWLCNSEATTTQQQQTGGRKMWVDVCFSWVALLIIQYLLSCFVWCVYGTWLLSLHAPGHTRREEKVWGWKLSSQ